MFWRNKRSHIDRLKEKYQSLMKKAFLVAPKNKKKSDYLNRQARRIFQELKRAGWNSQYF